MAETDRWGDSGASRDDSSDGPSTMFIWAGLILLLLLAAGGIMFLRMSHTQRQMAMEHAMAAQMEAEQRAAQAAQTIIRTRETLKAAFFPNQSAAIKAGDAVLKLLSNPADMRDPAEFVGQTAVLHGIGPGLRAGELDMILTDVVHLRVEIDKSKVTLPTSPGWSAFVLGKIVSIDRTNNTITMEVQPENWKLEPPQ